MHSNMLGLCQCCLDTCITIGICFLIPRMAHGFLKSSGNLATVDLHVNPFIQQAGFLGVLSVEKPMPFASGKLFHPFLSFSLLSFWNYSYSDFRPSRMVLIKTFFSYYLSLCIWLCFLGKCLKTRFNFVIFVFNF